MTTDQKNERAELRIQGVPRTIAQLIRSVAKNLNVSQTDFLRIEIGKIAIAHSKVITKKNPSVKNKAQEINSSTEIRIRNIDPETKNSLANISNYLNVNQSDFAKAELTKIINSFPENIRNGNF